MSTSVVQSAQTLRPVGMDLRCDLLSVERSQVALEREAALRRVACQPPLIRGTDGLARLAPRHVALEELIRERRTVCAARLRDPAHRGPWGLGGGRAFR